MSMFLSAVAADPEEQRFGKAVVRLRSLAFGPLSDDHVIALALLHELGELYRQAFSTDQVIHAAAQRGAQEEALLAHLGALGLPQEISDLEPCQVAALVSSWEPRYQSLPHPFDRTMRTFILYAKAQLSSGQTPPNSPSYQAR